SAPLRPDGRSGVRVGPEGGAARGPVGGHEQFLQVGQAFAVLTPVHAPPHDAALVRLVQLVPAYGRGRHGHVDEADQFGHVLRVVDAHEHLDAPVEVAVHEIGAADVDLGVPAAGEGEDPGVLEEPAEDRTHADILAQAGDAGLEGRGAAYEQV